MGTEPVWRRPSTVRLDGEPAAVSSPARLQGLDALRVWAMLMVVGLHAALGYVVHDIPRLTWVVRHDPGASHGFDLFCWWAMSVSNPLFFLLAGLLAATIWDVKGPREFLANRWRRVGRPFLLAFVYVLPATMYAWSCGWLIAERINKLEFLRYLFKDPELHAEQYGPAHLWFLEYLLLMLALFVALRWTGLKGGNAWSRAEAAIGRLLRAGGMIWALPVVSALILAVHRQTFGVDAALDRHNAFIPDLTRFLYFAAFFLVGVGLRREPGVLVGLQRGAVARLLLAAPVFLARAWLIDADLLGRLDEPIGRAALAAFGGVVSWLTISGLLGLAPRLVALPERGIRYLADASFWIYLIHFPIVGIAQADLQHAPIPAPAKFAIAWAASMGLGLASYHVMIRGTWAGHFLTGANPPHSAAGVAGRPWAPLSSRLAGRFARGRSRDRKPTADA